jgi:hypothetical protein
MERRLCRMIGSRPLTSRKAAQPQYYAPADVLFYLSVPKTSFVGVWRRRSFSDSPNSLDSAQIRSVNAFNDTNRASERHVPVKSVRRVVLVQAATRS